LLAELCRERVVRDAVGGVGRNGLERAKRSQPENEDYKKLVEELRNP